MPESDRTGSVGRSEFRPESGELGSTEYRQAQQAAEPRRDGLCRTNSSGGNPRRPLDRGRCAARAEKRCRADATETEEHRRFVSGKNEDSSCPASGRRTNRRTFRTIGLPDVHQADGGAVEAGAQGKNRCLVRGGNEGTGGRGLGARQRNALARGRTPRRSERSGGGRRCAQPGDRGPAAGCRGGLGPDDALRGDVGALECTSRARPWLLSAARLRALQDAESLSQGVLASQGRPARYRCETPVGRIYRITIK